MKLLVDAQALIWASGDPGRLGGRASAAMQDVDNTLVISSGTAWEISIKAGLGKLQFDRPLLEWFNITLSELQAEVLPITLTHAAYQASIPFHHRDPFDRLIIAQAICEGFPIISSDEMFDQYEVQRIW